MFVETICVCCEQISIFQLSDVISIVIKCEFLKRCTDVRYVRKMTKSSNSFTTDQRGVFFACFVPVGAERREYFCVTRLLQIPGAADLECRACTPRTTQSKGGGSLSNRTTAEWKRQTRKSTPNRIFYFEGGKNAPCLEWKISRAGNCQCHVRPRLNFIGPEWRGILIIIMNFYLFTVQTDVWAEIHFHGIGIELFLRLLFSALWLWSVEILDSQWRNSLGA